MKPALAYPNNMLTQLCLQANRQLALLANIKTVLPREIRDHAIHCVANEKILLVYTDSATWASQLRFYGEAMLSVTNQFAGPKLSAVTIKVIPALRRHEPKRKRNLPSPGTAKLIEANSRAVQDPELQSALLRLSATLTRIHQ